MRDVYALQLDIANFFNSIHRPTLFGLLQGRLVRAVRRQGLGRDDARALQAHCRALLEADPAAGVRRKGAPGLFAQVPPHKRLGALGPGVGLPIGNLTSQFFANVYLNELDQFVKHTLKARWYVRYVDDFVLLHHDPAQLLAWRDEIERFLAERLRLKLKALAEPRPLSAGVDFLGYVIRPFYKLVRRRVIHHLYAHLAEFERLHVRPNALRLPPEARDLLRARLASYLGHLRHAHSHRLWLRALERFPWLTRIFDQPENALGRKAGVSGVGCAERSEAQRGVAMESAVPALRECCASLRSAQPTQLERKFDQTVGCAERSEAQRGVAVDTAVGCCASCRQHNLRLGEAQCGATMDAVSPDRRGCCASTLSTTYGSALRPAWEPAGVTGLAGQYRAFALRFPDACVLMQVGKNWLAAGEGAIPLSRQTGVVRVRRPGLGVCCELPHYRLSTIRQKLKRAAILHILVAQTGAFKTGFKRRAMVLIWRPPHGVGCADEGSTTSPFTYRWASQAQPNLPAFSPSSSHRGPT